jgi:gluconate 2-dehydrogenase gamma chain
MSSSDKKSVMPQRRGFLKQIATVAGSLRFAPVLVGGVAAGTSLGTAPTPAAAQGAQAAGPVVGYISLSQDEAAFVETMVTIMCPADEFTPNGVDCVLWLSGSAVASRKET